MAVIESTKPQLFFRILCGIILAVLITALPLDRGGLYPWSKALLGVLIFTFISLKFLFPSGEAYPKSLKYTAGAYFIISLISVAFSTDRHLSVQDTLFHAAGAGVFVMGYYLSAEKRVTGAVLAFLQGILFINCAVALYYYLIIPSVIPRAHGNFFQPNVFGTFTVMLLPSALGAYFSRKNPWATALSAAVAAVSLSALILTDSTGALISGALVMIPAAYLFLRHTGLKQFVLRLCLLAVLSATVLLLAKPGSLSNRQEPAHLRETRRAAVADPESNKARLHFWAGALRIAAERPLTGWGAGTFGYQYTRYQKEPKFFSRYPHNFYLAVASERGFPALLAIWGIFISISLAIIRTLKSREPEILDNLPALWGLGLGLLGVLIHITVDVGFIFSGIFITFFAIAGFLSGLGQKEPEMPDMSARARFFRITASLASMALMFPLLNNYISDRLSEMGQSAEEAKEIKTAETLYMNAISRSPMCSENYRRLGSLYYYEGQPQKSLNLLNEAIKRSPSRARLYLLRGRILFEGGNIKGAVDDYTKAIELDPINQILAYDYLGESLILSNQPDKALEIFRKATAIYDNQDLNAIWHFRTDIIKPQLAMIHSRTANLLIEKKDYQGALESYGKSLSYQKGASAHFGMGYALYQMNRFPEAVEEFNKAVELDPAFPASSLYLHYIYQKTGNKELSDKYFRLYQKLYRQSLPPETGPLKEKKPDPLK